VKRDEKSRGRDLGDAVPFGYVIGDDSALIEDATQQKAIGRLRAQGLAYRTISDRVRCRSGHEARLCR